MTDRELLELAAKAAGYTLEDHYDVNDLYWPWCVELGDNWCPLTDDGDALRLAVKLGLDVEMHGCRATHLYACAFDRERNIAEEEQPADGDPYAATRRAIVRAAAEIGRAIT